MSEQIRIVIPKLCDTHRKLLVSQCRYGPLSPWRILEIVTNIALFQGASADPKVHAELGGDIEKMTTIGCLACRKPDLFGTLINRVQKTRRSAHFATIKQLGEQWITEGSKRS